MAGASNRFLRDLRRQQVEVGATTRDHRPLAGLVDEHGDATGEVLVGLDEVAGDPLLGEVLLGQLPESVAADLADELGLQAAAAAPHGDVGSAAARCQHHLAERVAATEQLAVGADQHVPGEVADDAQRGRHAGHGSRRSRITSHASVTRHRSRMVRTWCRFSPW